MKDNTMNSAFKLDILAIGAHPDDVEISSAATLLKASDAGKRIGIVDLTEENSAAVEAPKSEIKSRLQQVPY